MEKHLIFALGIGAQNRHRKIPGNGSVHRRNRKDTINGQCADGRYADRKLNNVWRFSMTSVPSFYLVHACTHINTIKC